MSDAIQMQKEWSFAKTCQELATLYCRVSMGSAPCMGISGLRPDQTGSCEHCPCKEVQEYPAGTTVLVGIAVQDQEADLVLRQMRMLPASADHYREEKYGGHC